MKNVIKLMPVALGLMTLASCSDYNDVQSTNNIQLKEGQYIATVEDAFDAEEGAGTRVGMGEFGEAKTKQFVWQKGDKAKIYAAKNWKTDILTVVEAADNNTKGVFDPAEGERKVSVDDLAYGVYPAEGTEVNEDRSVLTVNLPTTISYAKLANATYGEEEGSAYKCDRPLFGFAVDQAIKFRYLTSVLRIETTGALPANAKYVVVKSTSDADYLSGNFTADIKEISEKFFEDNTKGADYDIPVLKPVTTVANAAKKYVIVDLTKAVSIDNNIYIPIPAQKYAGQLQVYLATAVNATTGEITTAYSIPASKWKINKKTTYEEANTTGLLRQYDANKTFATTSVYTVGKFEGTATLTCNEQTLAGVNKYLAELKVDRDLTITFANPVASFDQKVLGEDIKSHQLIIPETWTGDFNVTLNFDKLATAANNNVELDQEGITVQKANLKAAEILNKSSLKKVLINSDAVIETGAVITVNLKESANSVTALGTNIKNFTLTAGKAGIDQEGENFTITVGETGNDKGASSITLYNGTITTWTPRTATTGIIIEGGEVSTLQLVKNQAQTITMNGGKIGTIALPEQKNTTATTITINTAGNAAITDPKVYTTEADKNLLVYNITATWDENTTGTGVTAQQNIYTAAQLLAAISETPESYKLCSNIVVADTKADGDAFANTSIASLGKALDGDKHTITGLKAPLFVTLGKNVSNLTLKNVAVVGENGANLGALAASVNAEATFNNVIVDGGTVGLAEGKAGSASKNVGGLIGATSTGLVTITDCAVKNVTVQGYANLGGFVGQVSGKIKFNKAVDAQAKFVSSEKSTVTIAKTFNTTEEADANCGTVGNFIGTVTTGTEHEITIGDKDYAKAFTDFFTADGINATALHFVKNKTVANKTYVGMPKHEIGYSTGEVTATKLDLYGATTDGAATPKTYTIKAASTNQVAMVNIFE